jgi:voltage-gated potassium channel
VAQPDRLTRLATRRLIHAFETGRILPSMVVTIIMLVFAFAAVMRVVDRKDFSSYGEALWWAVSTVTTVGYGDVVPTEPFGRLVAALLMAIGFAFLSLVTGTIASALVAEHIRPEPNPEFAEALDRIEQRLQRLEDRLGS